MATVSHRSSSRAQVPGGFDIESDGDLSPIRTSLDDHKSGGTMTTQQDLLLEGSSINNGHSEGGSVLAEESDTFLQERAMHRQLDDLDSTFLQEVSPMAPTPAPPNIGTALERGTASHDDSLTTGHHVDHRNISADSGLQDDTSGSRLDPSQPALPDTRDDTSPKDPGRASAVPQETPYDKEHYNTSALETMSSSPTAAAAARTVSRVVSMASTNYDDFDESRGGISVDDQGTPTRHGRHSSTPRASSPFPSRDETTDSYDTQPVPERSPARMSRSGISNSQMARSHSSQATTSTEEGSDATLGANYALQSGGNLPYRASLTSRPEDFARSVSLGSMASGISGISDDENQHKVNGNTLYTVDERDPTASVPETPAAFKGQLAMPTDTVIAQHVRNVEVPATLAREYGSKYRQPSPEKRVGAATPSGNRSGNNMTLKEQSNTIDRLMKENWNLKLKITFLDEALNRKSDESIKAMISENVELRTSKFQSAKDTRELKRSIRDLERRLKEKSEELSAKFTSSSAHEQDSAKDEEAYAELEEEVTYLRERITTYDVEIDKIRNEKFVQETEKTKLAEVVQRLNESSKRNDRANVSSHEDVEMWKDLLDAETTRREQTEDENNRLKDEIRRLRNDAASVAAPSNVLSARSRRQTASMLSGGINSERGYGANGAQSTASSTLVEQLRHENAELRREVGAQTSMLTSRNRERERLQQEIEDLKLGSRSGHGGPRSTIGESVFERSASRAVGRPGSRASDQTRATQLSDSEREALELRNGKLRDQNAVLRIEIQGLAKQAEEALDELLQLDALKIEHEKLQQLYDNDISLATEDLQNLQRERDEALRNHEDMEADLQEMRAEGSEKIGALEEELDQRNNELAHLQNELSNHTEDADALRKEVRALSENMLRVEDDLGNKGKRIRDLQLEMEELGQEADTMDKELRTEKDRNTKLSVQHESVQGEVSFLREEQEGDKIKIGDLEDALQNLKATLSSEKDRVKDLDSRLREERHQRDVIGGQEKQEVQRLMNDLNRDASNAKDDSRKLRKSLQSREIELTSFKERLDELESHLREILADPKGTRPSFISSITKLQKDLHTTSSELEVARHNLSEKERTLINRDALLESHGLESKKLADLLERERQGRRADRVQHEQWQRSHQHTSRTVSQKETRIAELESRNQADRKKISILESQYKDQLSERNSLLLGLWTRIANICGPDWQHQNSLINNHLPTAEVIANPAMYTTFNRNVMAAVKHVEGIVDSFQTRIKKLDHDLNNEYQSIEQTLDNRIKKLDRLEAVVQSHRISGTFTAAPEIAKLRGENRLLKSELATLQKQEIAARNANRQLDAAINGNGAESSAPPPTLARNHSTSAADHLSGSAPGSPKPPSISPSRRTSSTRATQMVGPVAATTTNNSHPDATDAQTTSSSEPSQQRWIHRLKELERRLKAEREARLLDRSGARKRLEEGAEENRRLKGELERERIRRAVEAVGPA